MTDFFQIIPLNSIELSDCDFYVLHVVLLDLRQTHCFERLGQIGLGLLQELMVGHVVRAVRAVLGVL